MQQLILVINTGSSSIKFSVFKNDATPLCEGEIEEIGGNAAFLVHFSDEGKVVEERALTISDHSAAIHKISDWISREYPDAEWTAIGHRIVHGGQRFVDPVVITDEVLAQLRELIPLDPLHQPVGLSGIECCQNIFKGVVQVACFDTAFHSTQPGVAKAFALPRYITDKGVRRFGFHGLSYQYISSLLEEVDPKLSAGRTIVAHLGNGASMCALQEGKSIATTMGFSVLDGVMMGTRCGSVDPGVLL